MSKKIIEEAAEEFMLGVTNPGKCEYCKRQVDYILKTPSMTHYPWDGKGEDPNRDRRLCLWCADDHVTYWENRWADYYLSIL
jgi:hypothetical protein